MVKEEDAEVKACVLFLYYSSVLFFLPVFSSPSPLRVCFFCLI